MRRNMTIAILAAICAVLAVAPATSMAKKVQYAGPVDLAYAPSPNGFATDPPEIELKVEFAHGSKTPTRVPAGTLQVKGLYSPCVPHSFHCNDYCSPTGVCEPAHCPLATSIFEDIGDFGFKINKRRSFSGVERVSPFSSSLAVTGHVGKSSVSGTVRAQQTFQSSSGATAFCDSGVLNWSATRSP